MSAIVALFYQENGIGQLEQEHFIKEGLQAMYGRAHGEIKILRCDGNAVLGQRESRLLAKGGWTRNGAAQCKINGRTISLIVSGFIDNADEICDWLGAGRELYHNSIALLLLNAYIAKGKGFVNKVGGSLAIVIMDDITGELHIIRDRLGIEPLYFWHSNKLGRVAVASEPKAILLDPQFPRVFDESAILDLFNSTSRIPGTTVYKYLCEVRPGEILSFQGDRVHIDRYWTLPRHSGMAINTNEAAEKIADLLNASIKRRVHNQEGSQAFLLSGGLDSSIICAEAHNTSLQGSKLNTFSFAYPDEESNFQSDALHASPDGPYVEIMRNYLGSHHERIIIDEYDFRTALEKTVAARDLPGVGDLDITLLWLFQRIKGRGQNEVFSGEGADDLFGGFPWIDAESNTPSHTFPWLRGTGAANFLNPALREKYDIDGQLKYRWKMVDGEMPYLNEGNPLQQHMDRVFYMQMTRFLPFLLDRIDRMSAAAGIRTQLPFLDHRLVEYAWDLDYNTKKYKNMEKGILRTAYEQKLPAEIAWRKKSGFAIVKNQHYTNAIVQYLKDMSATDNDVLSHIVDMDYLHTFIHKNNWSDGVFSAPPILPRIVMLDLWIKMYGLKFESSLVLG